MARKHKHNPDTYFACPMHCRPAKEELQVLHERELEDFERKVSMTVAEKKALRKWVASGHSLKENPGSKYICDLGMAFLDVYRADHDIAERTRGMTPAQKVAYIKEYTGYTELTPEELERMEAIRHTPAYVSERYEKLARQMLVLWDFLAGEGLYTEAKEYLEEHMDDDVPMPFSFIL